MYEFAIISDWLTFAVRWLHVITAMAWIGSSFYFIALDLGLQKRDHLPQGASGEEWQVHGGGFYHIQKYLVAPAQLPEHLTWFKWESYVTWLSGFALLSLVYYGGADLYLVDPEIWDVTPRVGIVVSLATLGFGWLLYDLLCRSKAGDNATLLMVLLYIILVAMAWGYSQLFTGRAAFLHLGAITATIMSANVFLIIIPNQKIVVADLVAGRTPDPKYGIIAKQRSTHNNYLTLPVIFLMLSNHYPLAFGTQYSWAIASLVFLMGVTIRHYFNSIHARKAAPNWTWLATTILFILIMWLSTQPRLFEAEKQVALSPRVQRFISSPLFSQVSDTVQGRCAMCHAAQPGWEGIRWAPKGVKFETAQQIAKRAREIYLNAGVSKAMPPANASMMEKQERALIRQWYESVVSEKTASR